MDTWQAIDTTRAIRKFADRPLEPEHLERILNAGRRSGSSKNQQNWDFVVCTDRAHLAELAGVGPYAQHLAGAAAAIALVTPDPATAEAPLSVMWDLGRAAQNMTLAAWELGHRQRARHRIRASAGPRAPRPPGRPPLRVPALIRLPGRSRRAHLGEACRRSQAS